MTDEEQVAVWVSMADHFLDTETRQDIPATALLCHRSNLTVEEVRRIWRDEVTPAVGFNLWQVAGEWTGWNRTWLIERIRRLSRRSGRLMAWLRDRTGALDYCRAIERCLVLLRDAPGDVEELADDLGFLAQHYFDFCPRSADAERRRRLRALYPEPFQSLMAPILLKNEAVGADQRARAALSG